jgi:L-threonylcarbamoyladenylate synthase
VFEDLAGKIDLILDGGPTAIGVESTILDLSGARPEILRPGGVSLETLREVLPNVSYTPRYLGTETAAAAPGSLLKHYSPRAELLLITGQRNAALRLIQTKAQLLIDQRQVPGILVPEEDLAVVAGLPAQILTLGPERDLDAIAHSLFANIRELDRRSVDTILVRGLSQTGLGLAIWDRLVRAAVGRVIDADKQQ